MIPKTIHYCWFGRNPKPELVQRCISSWRKYCPDYEIIEWNEENFDISQNQYAKEAYDAKKWAFVTDYARLWIIYMQGGIYLDTDVEVIKSLDDLLEKEAFFGFEDEKCIATGLGFGAVKGNKVVECMLKDYDNIHFLSEEGTYDKTPCPIRNTKAIANYLPSKFNGDKILQIDGATIFPTEYFCPLSADGKTMKKTKNTRSIHWYSATWLSEDEMVVHEWRLFKNKCARYFGTILGGYIARFVYIFKPKEREILKRM